MTAYRYLLIAAVLASGPALSNETLDELAGLTHGKFDTHARQPEWYVDADPATFASLTMDDLDAFMPDGCEQVWTSTTEGFRGYVDPKRCEIISSRTGKPRQIESENHLTRDTLSLAERGYDAETGEQLFGTAQGESLLLGRDDTPK